MRLLPMLAAALFVVAAAPAGAQSLKSDEVFSSISVQPVSNPNPVLGADGRVHLAYELLVTNPSNLFITLDKVEAIDAEGRGLWAIEGDALAAMTALYAGEGRMISPGGSALVFMDVSFGTEESLPQTVLARVTATRQANKDGKPVAVPADNPVPATYTFVGAPATVGKGAVVVAPPLKGKGWVAIGGCCDSITPHRGAVMSINGKIRVPERFAIDWVKLDDAGKLFTGDVSKLEDYAYFGAPIYAAADGVVVNLYDQAVEQVPGVEAKGITTENIAGNMLVLDMGDGAFALYAHMQPGSMKVKLGDRVKTGDVIGLLGNTGNSTAPHLHFHVMDGPSPLNANGLPYVFTGFSGAGVLAPGSDEAIQDGETAKIEPRLTGEHANQLPLNNQVVDFE